MVWGEVKAGIHMIGIKGPPINEEQTEFLIAASSKPFLYNKRKVWISKIHVKYLTFTSGNERRDYFTACKTNLPNCISEEKPLVSMFN